MYKPKKRNIHPANSLYNQCLFRVLELASNASKVDNPELMKQVDALVLEVAKQVEIKTAEDSVNVQDIIRRLAVNIVYGFTDAIPF